MVLDEIFQTVGHVPFYDGCPCVVGLMEPVVKLVIR